MEIAGETVYNIVEVNTMLFRKEIEPRCAYCARGVCIGDEQIACLHKGIVPAGYHCRKFEYDPLKRVPAQPAAPDFSKYKDQDFSL